MRAGAELEGALLELMLSSQGRRLRESVADVASWLRAYVSPEALASELEAFANQSRDLTAHVTSLEIPLLLRVGELDLATPPALAEEMAAGRQASRLEVVKGAGHALLSEDFDATAHSIERFLSAVALG